MASQCGKRETYDNLYIGHIELAYRTRLVSPVAPAARYYRRMLYPRSGRVARTRAAAASCFMVSCANAPLRGIAASFAGNTPLDRSYRNRYAAEAVATLVFWQHVPYR